MAHKLTFYAFIMEKAPAKMAAAAWFQWFDHAAEELHDKPYYMIYGF